MTDREKAIVMAYTGRTMLAGDKLGIFYKYVQEKLGRSVMTHELAYQEVQDAIEEAAKKDFIAIAKADNGWISVKDRLPESVANRVIVWVKDAEIYGHIGFGHYEKYKGQEIWFNLINNEAFEIRGQTVTHWMQLPEMPKEE